MLFVKYVGVPLQKINGKTETRNSDMAYGTFIWIAIYEDGRTKTITTNDDGWFMIPDPYGLIALVRKDNI